MSNLPDLTTLIPHVEALIFASEKPLSTLEITELVNNALGYMDEKITLDQVEAATEAIVEKYSADFYPFQVKQSGGGWQFLTRKDYHKTVAQLNGDKFLKRLSAAALETLAIIAYKQPVTKGEIEAIRGVSSDYAVQKLLEKELVIITGRNEKLPGHPLVYSTSRNFMDYFGINSAEELPKIREVLAEQVVEPTVIKDVMPTEQVSGENTNADESETLAVTEEGELIENNDPDNGEES
jgi:segregation and condensation protein B